MEPKDTLNPGVGIHWLNSSSANLSAVRLLVAFGKWLHYFKPFMENHTPLNMPLWKCFFSIQVCRTDIIIRRKLKQLLLISHFQQLQRLAYKIPEKWLPEFRFRVLSCVTTIFYFMILIRTVLPLSEKKIGTNLCSVFWQFY